MKKDTIETLFDRLQGEFDVFETPEGHQKRFMDRLQKQEKRTTSVVTWQSNLISSSFCGYCNSWILLFQF